jgi:molybdate transport system ATP-binding protein
MPDDVPTPPASDADPLLSLSGVSLVYRALPALRDINWRLEQGQQWACLGPNGSGKTSLARVISGQTDHYGGTRTPGTRLRRDGVAYVCFEQQKALCDRDRKLDDSEFRSDAADPGTAVRRAILGARPADAAFDHWVDRFSMAHSLDRGLRFISTGEMRKTLLVRALMARPALLILDSPLDGLDRASQAEMRAILDELLAGPAALLLLCRQATDIPRGISHVLVLDRGSVLCSGERGPVLDNPAVRSLMNPPIVPFTRLPPPQPRPYSVPDNQPLLALHEVSVAYGDLQVLRNVNWVFRRGQHCAISGPNGCGKSTLVSLVTGDNHKAYGQAITLFGRRRGSGESIWDIKQKFGQLDTQLHLNHVRGMGVLEVVVSGFFDTVGLYDDWGDQQRSVATDWLRALGLASYQHAGFDTLSFGLQRMVLLARAMVKSPLILLLDEPTLGLDGHHRALLLDAIDHIAAHSDTQVIFISHSAGETPACINQRLRFEPRDSGFALTCEESQSR